MKPRLAQLQSAYTAQVTSLAELLAVPGVTQVGNEIQIPTGAIIQIGGLISLPTNNYVTLNLSASLIGTNRPDARIVGDRAGALIECVTDSNYVLRNISVFNNQPTAGAACISAGTVPSPVSGARRVIENCRLQGVVGIDIPSPSSALEVRGCYFRTTGSASYGTGTAGVIMEDATSIKISDCDFESTTAFGVVISGVNTDIKVTNCRFYGISDASTTGNTGIRILPSALSRSVISECEFFEGAASTLIYGIDSSTSLDECVITGNRSFLTAPFVGTNTTTFFRSTSGFTNCQLTNNQSIANLYRCTTADVCEFSGYARNNGLFADGGIVNCDIHDLTAAVGYGVSLSNGVASRCTLNKIVAALACIRFTNSAGGISFSSVSNCFSDANMIYYGPSVAGALLNGATLVSDCRARTAFIAGDGTATVPAWTAVGFPNVGSRNNSQNDSLAGANYPLSFP